MTKISNKTFVILLGLVISSGSCTNNKPSIEAAEAEIIPDNIVELRDDQVKLAGVETGVIEMKDLGSTLKVNGIITVAPRNLATVCMPSGGFVKSTSLIPGNRVGKGQVLAIIENQDFVDIQQNFLETRNKLQYAEAEYNRHTDLYKNDVYSEQNLQMVTMEYKNLRALEKSLEQKLIIIGIDPAKLTEDNISSSVKLISPIEGYLKAVNVNIGKYVTPDEVLFEIVNTDNLFLELTLFEKDADKVVEGQKVKFFINNETEEHTAIISQTGRSVGNDRTFIVYATVTSSCKNLLPGMYVNAIIEETPERVTALPSEAVVSFDDKDYIFVFEKNKEEAGKPFTEYKIIEVKKGISVSGYTRIELPEGFDQVSARVVIKGAYNLLSAKKNAGEMAC